MKISIVIPIYNAESWIEPCVRNLTQIANVDYEIILVVDGATDSSLDICNQLKEENKRISVYWQKNGGVSSARNCGLASAKGEYILFFDVDDKIEIDKLNGFLNKVENNPMVDLFLFGMVFDYYSKGVIYRSDLMCYEIEGILSDGEWKKNFSKMAETNSWNSVCTKLFRRDIISSNNLLFNTNMIIYEDLEFVLRYLQYCKNIYNYPHGIYRYRIDEAQSHPGRRLRTITNLNVYIEQIAEPLRKLFEDCQVYGSNDQWQMVLIKLYLVLAGEKSDISSIKEIRHICKNASAWFDKQDPSLLESLLEQKNSFFNLLVDEKIFHILLRRFYIQVRHKMAVAYKSLICRRR